MEKYKFLSCLIALASVLCLGLTACGEMPGAENTPTVEPTPTAAQTPAVEPTPAVETTPAATSEPTPAVQPTPPQGEWYTLNANGRRLTLALEAEKLPEQDFYRVDAIKVYDGGQLLSTTDTAALEYEGDYLFDGVFFLRGEGIFWDPIVDDFNFDGNDDLCLMASDYSPKNMPFAYFLWNQTEQRLDFSFVLSNPLEVDDQGHCLIESIIGPAGSYEQRNTYRFDEQGKLTLLQSNGEEQRNQLICEFYAQTYQRSVYMVGEEPAQPQEGDLRIEEVTVLGETPEYEVTGQLLKVRQSRYYESDGWWEYSGHLVITKGIDNAYQQVVGIPTIYEGQTTEEIIRQTTFGLNDLEVSLSRDGMPPWLAGPGTDTYVYWIYDGPMDVEVLEGWEPIYKEGDYWAIRSWDGVEALCYYSLLNKYHGSYTVTINTFNTTRTDLSTYRGIRVGDSRAKVMQTYPELKSGDYWGKYPGEDYLWFCRSEQDFGAALIFFFENDTVSRIVLTDMFN